MYCGIECDKFHENNKKEELSNLVSVLSPQPNKMTSLFPLLIISPLTICMVVLNAYTCNGCNRFFLLHVCLYTR